MSHTTSIQCDSRDQTAVSRLTTPNGDSWLMIKQSGIHCFNLFIDGATEGEVDAIVSALNVPLERLRRESAQKIAAE